MEAVASGMAVASLALQLGQTVQAVNDVRKAFQNAPKEFLRLKDLLDRLALVLGDVKELVESQSSQCGVVIPLPLPSIMEVVQSCDQRIKPLKEMIERQKVSQPLKKQSKIRRFRFQGGMAMKTRDIREIEEQISREFMTLSTILSVNHTRISIKAFSELGNNQQSTMVTSNSTTISIHTIQRTDNDTTSVDLAENTQQIPGSDSIPNLATTDHHNEPKPVNPKSNTSQELIFPQHVIPLHSTLELFGVRYHKVVHTVTCRERSEERMFKRTKEEIRYEEHVYSWGASILRYGISVVQKRPYGSLFPSLTIYPVVEAFWIPEFSFFTRKLWDPIRKRDIVLTVQRYVASGEIHPFIKDSNGQSWLHVAATCLQPDVYRLLIENGVKRDLEGKAFENAIMSSFAQFTPTERQIDMLRTILETIGSPGDVIDWHTLIKRGFKPSIDTIDWLWNQRSELLWDVDTDLLNLACFRAYVKHLAFQNEVSRVLKSLSNHATDYVLQAIRMCPMTFLDDIFAGTLRDINQQWASYRVGSMWLDFLQQQGINLDYYSQSIIQETRFTTTESILIPALERKILMKRTSNLPQPWTLGWEWVPRQDIAGSDVLSEFSLMSIEGLLNDDILKKWPFDLSVGEGSEWEDLDEEQKARLLRSLDRKARKDFKRTGQRALIIEMPGAWVN